jgi:hypothetical protein
MIGIAVDAKGKAVCRLLATLLVTGVVALVAVGSAAAAPANFTAAERLCLLAGAFNFSSSAEQYNCSKASDFLANDFTPARALCENAYGGRFTTIPPGANFYVCFLT